MSEPSEARERREIYFSGQVQGVGFRYTTRQIAARYDVVGFVQNRNDGRVLLTVEGGPLTLDQFVDDVVQEMERHITRTDCRVLPASGEFTSFEVRP